LVRFDFGGMTARMPRCVRSSRIANDGAGHTFSTRCRAVRFHVRGVDHLRVQANAMNVLACHEIVGERTMTAIGWPFEAAQVSRMLAEEIVR
jgi:hypothetical protein